MSIAMLSLAGSSLAMTTNSTRVSKAAQAVNDANTQVQNDQQKVDERKADADRKAAAAQAAADELKNAKAAMARDQAALSQAKTRATLDVYT
jgi:hypothetical protein